MLSNVFISAGCFLSECKFTAFSLMNFNRNNLAVLPSGIYQEKIIAV
jgi:hypothetical protein